jgi:hypothetical protein
VIYIAGFILDSTLKVRPHVFPRNIRMCLSC